MISKVNRNILALTAGVGVVGNIGSGILRLVPMTTLYSWGAVILTFVAAFAISVYYADRTINPRWTKISLVFLLLMLVVHSICIIRYSFQYEEYSGINRYLKGYKYSSSGLLMKAKYPHLSDAELLFRHMNGISSIKELWDGDSVDFITDITIFSFGLTLFLFVRGLAYYIVKVDEKFNIGLHSISDAKETSDANANLQKLSISGKPYRDDRVSLAILTSEQKEGSDLPTVVILTAIKEEYMAVRVHLREIEDSDRDDTVYQAGIFQFSGGEVAKVIIRECGAKNTVASQEVERAIQNFKPDVIFFVGIAGSRKPKDFSIGDVIFPDKAYSYEGGKSEQDAFLARPDLANTSYTLLELAKKERLKDDWKVLIKGEAHKGVKADLGVIASGEKVVEHYDSGIGKILADHYNDTSAIEMEGFGFAKAATKQGREAGNILIGIVRGISDIIGNSYSDGRKDGPDRRPPDAKAFASDTAAAFAYWLIFKLYEKKPQGPI